MPKPSYAQPVNFLRLECWRYCYRLYLQQAMKWRFVDCWQQQAP